MQTKFSLALRHTFGQYAQKFAIEIRSAAVVEDSVLFGVAKILKSKVPQEILQKRKVASLQFLPKHSCEKIFAL